MQASDLQVIKDIPGYKVILKAVLKAQIQQLVENLAENTGEESVILTASVSDGSLSHLGSESGKVFLEDHDDIKSQFLGFCLKRKCSTQVEQLSDHTGEESVILTASVSDGSLSHLGSDAGKVFLEDHDDIKSQFLGFCLKHHHKQKQLEKEKQEREKQLQQQQQHQLQDPGGQMMMGPTTPTRYGPGPRPRFSPARVQTSPRQFSPRGVHPISLTRASPRGGAPGVRHEPYPGARPRKPLNFDPNRRPQPSSMRLPTDPTSAQKPIKIEAMDDDDDSADKSQTDQPKSVDSGKGDSGAEPTATDSQSPQTAPPHTPTDSIHSPAIRDDGSENSSSSTITNEPAEVKYSDTLPPGGLSLDSDLSNLMGAPSDTAKSDTSTGDSAAIDPNVNVKIESITESELDLEITGVEPGQMAQPDYGMMPNLQSMGYSPSTSGAQGGMGDASSQGYKPQQLIPPFGSRFYPCATCQKIFCSPSKLARHERTHTGERPYSCSVCSSSYTRKENLKRHMLSHLDQSQ